MQALAKMDTVDKEERMIQRHRGEHAVAEWKTRNSKGEREIKEGRTSLSI